MLQGHAADVPVRDLSPGETQTFLAGYFVYWVDTTGDATVTEVIRRHARGDFTLSQSDQLSAGFQPNAAVWISFELRNNTGSNVPWWLIAAENVIDEVQLHHVNAEGQVHTERTFRGVQIGKVESPLTQHLFALHLPDQASKQFYLRYQSVTALRIAPWLLDKHALEQQQAREGLFWGGYFGIMLITIIISIYRALYYRHMTDMTYAVYLIGLDTATFVNLGIYRRLGLEIQLEYVHLTVASGITLASAALILFAYAFIEWPRQNPAVRQRVWHWLGITVGLFALGAATVWLTSPSYVYTYVNILGVLTIAVTVSFASYTALKGYVNARWFLLAFLPFAFGYGARILEGAGLLEMEGVFLRNFFYTSLFHVTILLAAIVMSEGRQRRLQEKLGWELEQTYQALEKQANFTRMLAHEIRTPLAVIDSHAQLLSNAQRDPDGVTDCVPRLRASVKQINAVLETFLTEDRLAQPLQLTRSRLDLGELIATSIEATQHRTQHHLITLSKSADNTAVWGDQQLLQVAFANLLDNAVRYSPDGGNIQVTIARADDAAITASVHDEGVGISPASLDRIFDRYFRTQQLPDVVGSGLGLYLVRLIIEQHGGSITCRSVLGEGTTFEVTLPLAD